jgi:hypothetical protein
MINKEWDDGFKAGYDWCKWLSGQPKGTVSQFFPNKQGIHRHGFAEGTISGGHHFNVSWKFTINGNEVEKQ